MPLSSLVNQLFLVIVSPEQHDTELPLGVASLALLYSVKVNILFVNVLEIGVSAVYAFYGLSHCSTSWCNAPVSNENTYDCDPMALALIGYNKAPAY